LTIAERNKQLAALPQPARGSFNLIQNKEPAARTPTALATCTSCSQFACVLLSSMPACATYIEIPSALNTAHPPAAWPQTRHSTAARPHLCQRVAAHSAAHQAQTHPLDHPAQTSPCGLQAPAAAPAALDTLALHLHLCQRR
jgi:hypothetical protein